MGGCETHFEEDIDEESKVFFVSLCVLGHTVEEVIVGVNLDCALLQNGNGGFCGRDSVLFDLLQNG